MVKSFSSLFRNRSSTGKKALATSPRDANRADRKRSLRDPLSEEVDQENSLQLHALTAGRVQRFLLNPKRIDQSIAENAISLEKSKSSGLALFNCRAPKAAFPC